MDFSFLDMMTPLIIEAKEAMTTTSLIAWRLGVVIASIGVIFGISVRIAGGGGGIIPAIVGWLITTGLVLGAISFWPAIMQESFNTASEVSGMIGGSGIQVMDVLERGANLASRVVDAARAQASLTDMGSWLTGMHMLGHAAWIWLMHFIASFAVAGAILEFWLVGAVLPLLLPFTMVMGMQGIGFAALIWTAGMTLRLVLIAMILAAATDMLAGYIIPGPNEEHFLVQYLASDAAAAFAAFLVWQTSVWGKSVIQAAAGADSIFGLAGQALSGARVMTRGGPDGRR